jgi:hypothetical protein
VLIAFSSDRDVLLDNEDFIPYLKTSFNVFVRIRNSDNHSAQPLLEHTLGSA